MLKILFVDDESNLLDGLKRMLRKKKDEWDMTFLTSARDALELISNSKFDIIVSDYRMPEIDGLTLLNRVKEISPETKRIILSGQSEAEVFDEIKKTAHIYISKPCDPEELISAIARNTNEERL
jgi:DNA-binding NtrC family response regulator